MTMIKISEFTSNVLVFFLLAIASVTCNVSLATSTYTDSWRKVDFETYGGIRLIAELSDDSINYLSLTYKGDKIEIPNDALKNIGMPQLNRIAIYESAGGGYDGVPFSHLLRLQFPIYSDGVSEEKYPVVAFIFDNGTFVARCRWTNSNREKLTEALSFEFDKKNDNESKSKVRCFNNPSR